ncbi:sensor domain-containing protein [Oceanobacillus halophilus]|uniref:Bifunctional diguanylate cyclase/phosphodiesterase n=1 Tax=Oceanobacillus halophilus TaxID=930130 RepID=A0A494ZTT7_9BACI|nr:bifunctional diguanylate cyclase/phosphodiesterase [Oceanobacillus halophilus]RKQ29649.1 bifunctional diguanylate cyclase/phosphodiesterase [Oceanobacillus halophilus]
MNENKKLKHYLEADNRFYNKLLNSHTDTIYILDTTGKIIYCNEGFSDTTGYKREELINEKIFRILHPEDKSKVKDFLHDTLNEKITRREFKIVHSTGKIKNIFADAVPISVDDENLGIFVIGKDITQYMQWFEQKENQDKKFRYLIKKSSDIISIINSSGNIVYFSSSLETVLGYQSHEMSGDLYQLIHPDDKELISKEFQYLLTKGTNDSLIVEFRLKHKNGEWRYFQAVATNLITDPIINGVVVNYRDITELKLVQEEAEYLAYHDFLTGLPNRRFFEEKLQKQLETCKENKKRLAVLFVDLDNFKSINDTLGHESGDRLLIKVAHVLKRSVPKNGMISRWGGDEFIIMLPNIKHDEEIYNTATSIKSSLKETISINQYELNITGSIGISSFPESGEDIDSLLRTADLAMYLTKERGKGDFYIFTPDMLEKASKSLRLQHDLYQALSNNEFELFYQPKVNAKSEKICGAEALIRWNHPTLGMLYPDDFIYLAEESGLIVRIGEWVYQEACKQVKKWKEAGKEIFKVSINFSTLQFLQKDLVGRIASFLDESGIEGKWLEVEITESILIQNDQELVDKIEGLKKLGVQIALDDFGKGYSSLDYLRKFNFSTLKLDKDFIKDIHTNRESEDITSFIIALGKRLNINIVAEGVECEEQAQKLKKLECNELQGFLFSKPVSVSEFEKLL